MNESGEVAEGNSGDAEDSNEGRCQGVSSADVGGEITGVAGSETGSWIYRSGSEQLKGQETQDAIKR